MDVSIDNSDLIGDVYWRRFIGGVVFQADQFFLFFLEFSDMFGGVFHSVLGDFDFFSFWAFSFDLIVVFFSLF